MIYIYAIRSETGCTLYVGQTRNFEKRVRQHTYTGKIPNGGYMDVLETVEAPAEANTHEQWWMICYRACGVKLQNKMIGGMLYDEETRQRISQARLGKRNPHSGHKWSAEQRAKYIASMQKHWAEGSLWYSQKRLDALSDWNKRRVVTAEYRNKIAATLTGRKNPHKGHKQSPETIAKRIASIRAKFNGGWRPQTEACMKGITAYNQSRQKL